MKVFKVIVIAILVIIALPFVLGLFVNPDYKVEREIEIKRPKEEVFEYIKQLKNQDNFSTWAEMDPNMEKNYSGEDGTIGFISSWDSDNKDVGKGEQEIINIIEGERIDFELRFKEPFESEAPAYMITEKSENGNTIVKWGFEGHMDYPGNFMLLFMDMEEMLGNDFSKGLSKLKAILEKPAK